MKFILYCLLLFLTLFSCSAPQNIPADGTTVLTLYVDDGSTKSSSMIRPDTNTYPNQSVSHYRFLMYSFATKPDSTIIEDIADGSYNSDTAFTSSLLPKNDGVFKFSGMPSGDWWVVKAEAYIITDQSSSTDSITTIPDNAYLVSTGTSDAVHLVSSSVETNVSINTPVSSESAGNIAITVNLPTGCTALTVSSCTIKPINSTDETASTINNTQTNLDSDSNTATVTIQGTNLRNLEFGSYTLELTFDLTVGGNSITRTGSEVLYWIPGLPATGSIDLAYSVPADTGGLDIIDNSGSEIKSRMDYWFNESGGLDIRIEYDANKNYELYVYIDNTSYQAGSPTSSDGYYVWTISDIPEEVAMLKVIIKDQTPYGIGSYEAELNNSTNDWTLMTVSGEGEETT